MRKKLIFPSIILFLFGEFFIAGTVTGFQNDIINHDLEFDILNPVEDKNILSSIPMSFTENYGQITNDEIRFYVQGGGLWFTNDEVQFEVRKEIQPKYREQQQFNKSNCLAWKNSSAFSKSKVKHPESEDLFEPMVGLESYEPFRYKRTILKQQFMGSNRVRPFGRKRLSWDSNFFYGNDSSKWRTQVPNYKEIYYKNLYNGIDLRYYTNNEGLKYDFIINPGADINQIKIRYKGANNLKLDKFGNLVIKTKIKNIIDSNLHIYQNYNGAQHSIKGKFFLYNNLEYSFKIQDNYNNQEVLIIDPLLKYSAYLGGNADDFGYDIKVDSIGNTFITGKTESLDYIGTPNALDPSYNGNTDCFIFKLNPDGSKPIHSTFLGGSEDDNGYSIEIDSKGNTFVTGYTKSTDFPTTKNANSTSLKGNYDVFIIKLNSTGSELLYSTYIGGNSYEKPYGISVDSAGNAYIIGLTTSHNFPTTPGAYKINLADGFDIFALKINHNGSKLIYSTYIGGTSNDYSYDIAIDSMGNAFITGQTLSSDFPLTSGVFDDNYNGSGDVFVLKLNWNGSDLEYSTFIGGSKEECGYCLTLDLEGNAYVSGKAQSGFPTTVGAFDRTYNNWTDAFVLKLNENGTNLIFSTYMGGNDSDHGRDIVLDSNGNIYVTGYTWSPNFPTTPDALNIFNNGMMDVFIFKLNTNGTKLVYSTFIGGEESEYSEGIIIDSKDNLYLVGYTNSSNFPTTKGVFGPSYSGKYDAFILKFSNKPYIKISSFSFANGNKDTKLIYSMFCPYTFKIDLIDSASNPKLTDVHLIFDPNGENIELLWDHSTNQFEKFSDPNNYVSIDPSSRAYKYFYNCWSINFNVTFNWTYPDEKLHDLQAYAINVQLSPNWYNTSKKYYVENDLVFKGKLKVKNENGREIHEKDIIRGGGRLSWTGLIPVYEGTSNIYPPNDEFDITIWDEHGDSWSSSPATGQPLSMETLTTTKTNLKGLKYTINISKIPLECDKTNEIFTVQIDGDGVKFSNPKPDKTKWHITSEIMCSINIIDIGGSFVNGSSIKHCISMDNGSTWSEWKDVLFLESKASILANDTVYVNDGKNNLIKWQAKDTLGNGPTESGEYRILVDTENVIFTNPKPLNIDESKTEKVEVGITISDLTSGVNASSIEYSISTDDGLTWTDWQAVSGLRNGPTINITLNLTFPNGTRNRIKWRASDIAGNGPEVSEEYKINVNNWQLFYKPKVNLLTPKSGSEMDTHTPTLSWIVDYNGTDEVIFDIILWTNKTYILFENDYPFNNYTMKTSLEAGKRYYWKILPKVEGTIGFESETWWFIIKSRIVPIFDFQLYLIPSEVEIYRGSNATVKLKVQNLGEVPDFITLNLYLPNNSPGINTIINDPKSFEIDTEDIIEFYFNIEVASDANEGEFSITIKIKSTKASEYGIEFNKTAQLIVNVISEPENESENPRKKDDYQFIYIGLIILIIIIILTYNRIQKINVLANAQRKAIYELIKQQPSIYFREIMRRLSLKPGSLSYHLNVLEKENLIESIQKGEYRCFYINETKSNLKIILSKIQQKILFIVNETPGISLTELSNALERNKMVIYYNTQILEDVGIIKQEMKGRIINYYIRPEAIDYLGLTLDENIE